MASSLDRSRSRAAGEVNSALARAAGRTAGLLRSGLDPAAPVPGLVWNAGETAAHLVADLREHTALLTGSTAAPSHTGEVGNAAARGAAANRAQLTAFPEREPHVLADRLEAAAADYNAVAPTRAAGEAIRTANGVMMTPPTLSAVLLGEQLIHGLDLARSAGRPWPIERADALLVIPGLMAIAGDYLDPRHARGIHATYEIRFGADERYRFTVHDATATISPAEGAAGKPDCIINADPIAFLLVGYGRSGQWGQILRAKLRASGRKPWLAVKFSSLLINP